MVTYPRDFSARLRGALLVHRPRQRRLATWAAENCCTDGAARLWRSAGNYDRALKCLEKAEKVARELKDEKFSASFHTSYTLSVKA